MTIIKSNNHLQSSRSTSSSTSTSSIKHHKLDQSQLKSLTENLRLRLRYAKLKVINGWHHQSLNEIESTICYLIPKQRQASIKKLAETPPRKQNRHQILTSSSSSSIPSSSSSTSSNLSPGALDHPHQSTDHVHQQPEFTIDQSILNDQPSSSSSQREDCPISKSQAFSTATLTLPLNYSTPFKKIIRTGAGDQPDSVLSQSGGFWLSNLCSTSKSSNRTIKRRPSDGLFITLDGNRTEAIENELFPAELYKHSSPASFLFNSNNYHRTILGSSSAKKSSSKQFINSQHLEFLNSISPVQIRSSNFNAPNNNPNNPRSLLRFCSSSSLASPSPHRTFSNQPTTPLNRASLGSKDKDQLVGDSVDSALLVDNKENSKAVGPHASVTRPSPVKFKLKTDLHQAEETSEEIGLDDLDQMIWK